MADGDEIGIRKPSLYHHFPSKAALGRAVMARYRSEMAEVAERARATAKNDPWAGLAQYLEPMLECGQTVEGVCLAGVAGAEYLGVPKEMREEISAFFKDHERWMGDVLRAGREQGVFAFSGSPEAVARMALGALEGGLLIKRATNNRAFFGDVVESFQALLMPAVEGAGGSGKQNVSRPGVSS